MIPDFIIYTDGSYKPNTNQGGYSVIITKNQKPIKILHYGYKNTTNNRQELLGVINALLYFKTSKNLIIYTDSNYIVQSINNNWLESWINNNEDRPNIDLWKQLHRLLQFHKVKIKWIKGHANNIFNELADLYANISAITLNPQQDVKF